MSSLYSLRFIARNDKGEFMVSPEVFMGNGYYFMFGNQPIFDTTIDVPDDVQEAAKYHFKFLTTDNKLACYTDGFWFTKSDLDPVIDKWFNSLEEQIVRKYEWEKLQHSLEYMKLPDEEKENVAKTFEDVDEKYDDEPDFHRSLIEELLKIKGMFAMYEPVNDDPKNCVYGFLYNITSSPTYLD